VVAVPLIPLLPKSNGEEDDRFLLPLRCFRFVDAALMVVVAVGLVVVIAVGGASSPPFASRLEGEGDGGWSSTMCSIGTMRLAEAAVTGVPDALVAVSVNR
jgi:hypothetical protein